jgi:hypothetical protein
MKTRRIAEWAYNLIQKSEQQSLNTHEIYDEINRLSRNGVMMYSLANVLSKCPAFEEIGKANTASISNHSYEVCLWTTTDNLDNGYTRHMIAG